ncbi:hypothetical protein WJX72_001652 [[Myrmecia] bisecta]|uniref:U-box domain-containing protein n=1 Tax=[Myrmecia] bisecta TaxID=41462 RepID=A0AAW1PS81_9CHLO
MGSSAPEASAPTAPPDLEAPAAPLVSTSSRAALLPITNLLPDGGRLVQCPATLAGDESLYRDLLRKAHGDQQLVAKWMAEIGASAPASSRSPAASPSRPAGKDFDAAASEAGAPATFFCPISFKVFRDPVMLPTGQTYERRYIERWLAQGNMRCPATGLLLTRPGRHDSKRRTAQVN